MSDRIAARSRRIHFQPAARPIIQEQMMKGQESKKTAKKEPAKSMKEKKAAKKTKKEEKQRQ